MFDFVSFKPIELKNEMMVRFTLIILLTICSFTVFAQQGQKLYPVYENNKWGYIDYNGKTVIKPQFNSAGYFSEGLAPVRLNGTYGYVDLNGNFVIKPQFDFAMQFVDGIGMVYINSKPFFIDKNGIRLFDHDYKSISEFGANYCTAVCTKSEKYGVIDRSGKLIVDTTYQKIGDFSNGVAIISGNGHNPAKRDETKPEKYEIGVIDSLGNRVVEFGIYNFIDDFINGYSHVQFIDKNTNNEVNGIIDTKGKYRFTIPRENWELDPNNYHFVNDLAIINVKLCNPDTLRIWSSSTRFHYKGVINPIGEIVVSNPAWNDLTPFVQDRAFAKDTLGNWYLINTKGEMVTNEAFKNIIFDKYNIHPEYLFTDGIALVETEKGLGAIDTSGNFVIKPRQFHNFTNYRLIRIGNLIVSGDYSVNDFLSGGHMFVSSVLNKIDVQDNKINFKEFEDCLNYVRNWNDYGYMDSFGNMVWKQRDVTNKQRKLNIDFMIEGSYYAASKSKAELDGFDGWWKSDNNSKPITDNGMFQPKSFQIAVDLNEKTIWKKKYDAFKLYIANTTKDTVFFNAQNSRLYLKFQAKDMDGNWKDIEYLDNSFCGNSYHHLFLAPNEYWELAAPVFYGEFKTKLRAELRYIKNKNIYNQNDIKTLYSKEFDGYINPGQLWNRKAYYPNGLNDAYIY